MKCLFDMPADLWPVEIDEGQMSQVINNLIINAQQAMPAGGSIQVACSNVCFQEECPPPLRAGKYVKISVQDSGIGIPQEHFTKIFDPYFTTKPAGSGLGLATAYSIIRMHDGYITVESVPGSGTTFYLYLPASEKRNPATRVADEAVIKGEGRILVMDDEQDVREVASEMLKTLGYKVEVAGDGAQAITLYSRAKEAGMAFHAVIMDLTVPGGMGGEETLRKLREIDPGIKAIVSSGYSNDRVLADYKQYGFAGVVAKPYTITKLGEVMARVVRLCS